MHNDLLLSRHWKQPRTQRASTNSTARNGLNAIALENVTNVRDLGGIPTCGKRRVARGILFRGGALHGMTERDRMVLFGELGVRTVVDVRCGWERDAAPDPCEPGVENVHIPFYDKDIVGIEYTETARGTVAIGHDIACDPLHFYGSLANPLTAAQIGRAARFVLSSASQGRPVYQHCSGGKDRTGIVSLVVLTVLGASREDILADYMQTNIARDRDYERTFARFLRLAAGDEKRARELVEEHRAAPANLDAFYRAVEKRYGSMDAFVRDELGIDSAMADAWRIACTEPCEQDGIGRLHDDLGVTVDATSDAAGFAVAPLAPEAALC